MNPLFATRNPSISYLWGSSPWISLTSLHGRWMRGKPWYTAVDTVFLKRYMDCECRIYPKGVMPSWVMTRRRTQVGTICESQRLRKTLGLSRHGVGRCRPLDRRMGDQVQKEKMRTSMFRIWIKTRIIRKLVVNDKRIAHFLTNIFFD